MALFSILHASDLHMAAVAYNGKAGLPGFGWLGATAFWRMMSHDLNGARAFAQFAFTYRNRCDGLVISGDLATTGESADLQEAHGFCTRPASRSSSYLSSLGRPTLAWWSNAKRLDLLPGNHDRYLPAGLGQGDVESYLLAQLKKATTDARDDIRKAGSEPITLWAIHFDPSSSNELLELVHAADFIQAAADLKVAAVLCGHTHESKLVALSKETTLYACGTTMQAGSAANDCQVLDIDPPTSLGGKPMIRTHWFRYDRAQFHHIGSR